MIENNLNYINNCYFRYDFFDEIMQKTGANKIAVAHNKNDNAETILMNIIQGASVNGQKGIVPINKKISGWFLKPIPIILNFIRNLKYSCYLLYIVPKQHHHTYMLRILNHRIHTLSYIHQ